VLERRPLPRDEACPVATVIDTGAGATYRTDTTVKGYSHHSDDQADALRAIGAHWVHVTPLRTLDRTIGSLTFMRREERPFDADEVAMASQLADRAVHALENARLHGQVRRLADRESRRAAELEAVLGAVNEGFLLIDADGIVQSSNAAAGRLLGGPVPTLKALLARLIDSGEASPRSVSAEPSEYRLRHRPAVWIEVTAYPIPEAAGVGTPPTVVVCRDVTAFRQGQALREAFLGLLSHELRTPVTTIYGGAAVLTRPGGHLDSTTAGEVLGDIAAEADRLYRLVEDLLVLARFDEGFELGADPVLLQRVVPAVVEQERGRWPGVAFDLDLAPDLPAVSGDETSITQVVRNLVSNASKYSGVDATVQVTVEPTDDGVVVRVLDEGPGIDAREADHLFDAFYRSPATATLASGAGIGLYVSRRLVDAMGGRIWAARRPEQGSEFAFALPRYSAEDDPA
jgi:signal transduction histidine kinase